METLESMLAQQPFFQDLDTRYLPLLVSCARNVRFQAGTYVLRAGEEADQFYLLRYGKVALQVFVPHRGPLTIETLAAGEVLGWSWLFPPYLWQFDAQAVDLVRAIAFDGHCLRAKCNEDHGLGYDLMQRFAMIMLQRLQATRLQLLDLYNVQA